MTDNISSLKTQIGFNKKQGWYGSETLLNFISRVTSKLGIIDYELYKLTLKEYHKNQDIYDMEHNDMEPYHRKLLMAKVLSLAIEDCKYITTAMPEREKWVINYFTEFLGVAHNMDVIKEYGAEAFKLSDYSSYPSIPRDIALIFWDVLESVKGLIDIKDHPRSGIDLHESFVRPAMEGLIIAYYANWDKYQVNPELWFNKCVDIVKSQVYIEEHRAMMEIKMGEIIKAHMARGVNMTTHRPKYQVKAYGIFHGMLNLFR